MKTKFIILLTILSGLIYCSNAFGWTPRYTVTTKDSTITISGAFNYCIDSTYPQYKGMLFYHGYNKLVLKGNMDASSFYNLNKYLAINVPDSTYLRSSSNDDDRLFTTIDMTDAVITSYDGYFSGNSAGISGVTKREYNNFYHFNNNGGTGVYLDTIFEYKSCKYFIFIII